MSSSSTASSSSASLLTSSRLRLSGTELVSGLDTDSIIKKLVAGTQGKIDSRTQKEQIAEWKQEAYRDIISQLQTFSNTYFSYANKGTNFLSSSSFDLTSITSSSPLVSATGSAGNAQDMTIRSISQLASRASYTSSRKVTGETIASGKIQTEWTKSDVGGKILVLSYEGTDYDIRLGEDLQLDSADASEDKVQKIVDELNKQVGATDGLNGKLSFGKDAGGKITLKTADASKSVRISSYQSDDPSDMSGKKFLKALGFTDGSSGSSITGSEVDATTGSYLFNKTVGADSELKLNVNGQEYTLALGSDYDISDGTQDSIAKNIAALFEKQIDADDDLKGKITVSAEGGSISFQADGSGATVSVAGGSQNLLEGLGLTAGGEASGTVSGAGIDKNALTTSYLADTLSGHSVTFDLDGLQKTVSFDENDLKAGEDFSSAKGVAAYLSRKLDGAFGSGKVAVSDGADGRLVFTAGPNAVLSLASSDDADVLSAGGALRIDSGETNRAEMSKTLGELSGKLSEPLETGSDENAGKYVITINGKDFTFSNDDTLSDVVAKINGDGDANVTASYSQTTDTFRITYDETGSHGKTDVSDAENGGNLAAVLFGAGGGGIAKGGTDLKMSVTLNGSELDVTRSSNTTTIDGVNLTVTGTTPEGVDDAGITFSSDSNVDDLYQKISDFVNDYNKIIDSINTAVTTKSDGDYPPLTDDQKESMSESEITKWESKAKEGILQNDSTLSNLLSDLRSAMTGIVDSAGTSLGPIGISTAAYDYTSGGQLTIDPEALKQAIASNPDRVASLFTAEDGVSQRVKDVLDRNVGTFGGDGTLLLIAGTNSRATDTSELGEQIADYKNTISDLKDELKTEEDRYWDQFTAMEQSLSVLMAQSSYFSSMMGNSSSS